MLPAILFVLIGACYCSASKNQYFDNVLHTSLQSVLRSEKLEPTHLEDFNFNYTDKTFLAKVRGRVEYKEGTLDGLSKVERASECSGPVNTRMGARILCNLSLSSLTTSHKGTVKYGVLPKVSITAKAEVSTTVLSVEITQGPIEGRPRVTSFYVRTLGQLTSRFSGLGPVLNKNMKVLEDNYLNRMSIEVYNVIVGRFQYALNLAVSQVPMPMHEM